GGWARGRSAPRVGRRVDDGLEVRLLLVGGDRVALHRRGEAALPAEAELLPRDVPGGLLDPPLEVVLLFQRSALGGHEAENDHLSLRHEAQRLERTGPRVVVLQEEAVDPQTAEDSLGDVVVAARRGPRGP